MGLGDGSGLGLGLGLGSYGCVSEREGGCFVARRISRVEIRAM